jgi:hypothetical protein
MDFEKNGHGKSWKSRGILNGRRCTNPVSNEMPPPPPPQSCCLIIISLQSHASRLPNPIGILRVLRFPPVVTTGEKKDSPRRISRENSLDLIELSCVNQVKPRLF